MVITTLQWYWPLNLEWLAYFEHVAQSSLNTYPFCCQFFHSHLTTHHSYLSVRFIVVFDLGTSTLGSLSKCKDLLLKAKYQ
jgi:hypothetical protein